MDDFVSDPGPPPLALDRVLDRFKRATLYIAIHTPIYASDDSIADLKLLWWNEVYGSIRQRQPQTGSLVSETYVNPNEVLQLATMAMANGIARQQFTLNSHNHDPNTAPPSLDVTWIAHDGLIVEVTEDLTQLRNTQAELEIRRLELADAHHRQQLSQLREKLASNMHDRLVQQLFAIGIGIESALQRVTDEPAQQLRSCQEQLQYTIDEIRQMVRDLDTEIKVDPAEAQRREISAEISEMALALGFTPSFHSNLNEPLHSDLRYDISAVIRESLANAARHSGASKVAVTIDRSHYQLTVVTSDNGRGFSTMPSSAMPSNAMPSNTETSSHGLRNMTRRAQHHGGQLILRTTPGGAEVIWTVPL
jgi:signal transduction histidine kinase